MERKIEYTLAVSDEDLQQILKLQAANLPSSLTEKEFKDEGFVSIKHDIATLREMGSMYPHIIAKDKSSDPDKTIIGYTLCMFHSASETVELAKSLFQRIDASQYNGKSMTNWKYFVMGQVCIEKAYRGNGIFQGLYQHMKLTMSPHFDCIVTAISKRNTRSFRAHEKVGFQVIMEYHAVGDDWLVVLWDWKDPIGI